MARQITRAFKRLRHKSEQAGFTIVEILVAFMVMLMIVGGLTTAVTASMRLNSVQKQRAMAQDIARDVMSRYVKSTTWANLQPFFQSSINASGDVTYSIKSTCYNPAATSSCSPSTYFGSGISPFTEVVYDASGGTLINRLNNSKYGLDTTTQQNLVSNFSKLTNPKLEILTSPIQAQTSGADTVRFFTTKVNVIVRISWKGNKIELPAVVGEGDLSRTNRGAFQQPSAAPGQVVSSSSSSPAPSSGGSPTPTPTPTGSTACTQAGTKPSSNGDLPCCTGLTPTGPGGKCETAAATPTPTPTPAPTATPTPTPAPTATPNPTPTPCTAAGNVPPGNNAGLCCNLNGVNGAGKCK